MPEVTVLIPVHNAASFLGEALDSVLAQTFADFEIVLVDDGSTDDVATVLDRYRDPRLRVIRRARRGGTAVALNDGIKATRGRLIAQMHADDVALPNRLERQISFLRGHPDIGIVGGNQQPVGPEGGARGPATHLPTLPGHIHWMLHVHNCLNHPTVVVRRDVMAKLGGYRRETVPAEDYALWVRAMEMTRIANVPDVVLRYRIHPGSASIKRAETMEKRAVAAAEEALTRLLGAPPDRNALVILRDPSRAEIAPVHQVGAAAALLWRFTEAVMDSLELDGRERSAIRRSARRWYSHMLRATARRRPSAAARLLSGRPRPPVWLGREMAAIAWRRLGDRIYHRRNRLGPAEEQP